MMAVIAAVILDVTVNLIKPVLKSRNIVSIIILAASFAASFFFGINTIYIILAAIAIGIIAAVAEHRKKRAGSAK